MLHFRAGLALLLELGLISGVAAAQAVDSPENDGGEEPVMALHEAAKAGLIVAVVTGLGSSSGDALEIRIQRRKPERLRIGLVPGTVFVPASLTVQEMAGLSIRGGAILLDDDEVHTHTIEAYCLDFTKSNPSRRDRFTIDRVDRSVGVFLLVGQRHLNTRGLQSALWIALNEDDAFAIPEHFEVSRADLLRAVTFVALAKRGKLPASPDRPPESEPSEATARSRPPDPPGEFPFSRENPFADLFGRRSGEETEKPATRKGEAAPAAPAGGPPGFGGAPQRGFDGGPQRSFSGRR